MRPSFLKLFYILFSLSLISCSHTGKAPVHYMKLMDKSWQLDEDNINDIYYKVTRRKSVGMVLPYVIKIYPITKPMIIAQARSDAYKNNWSEQEYKDHIQRKIDRSFADKKQDFILTVGSNRSNASDPRLIHGYLVDSYNQKYPLIMKRNNAHSNSSTTSHGFSRLHPSANIITHHSVSSNFYTATIAFYIDGIIDLSKPFKVVLDLRYYDTPKEVVFEWEGTYES